MDLQEELGERSDYCAQRGVLVLVRELAKSRTAPRGVTGRKCLTNAPLGVCLGVASLTSSRPVNGFRKVTVYHVMKKADK